MMTKYVLHGGEVRNSNASTHEFYKVLSHSDKASLNILCVYFARPEYKWEDLFSEDKEQFEATTNKHLNIKLASEENFDEELDWADVVFFKGGDGPDLTNTLSHYTDLKDKLNSKVVGAISAGVNALCTYYYSKRAERVLEGLGILPFKVFTHYESDLESELHYLERWEENLETITIPEGQFTILER
jgi:hypothetical protein